MLTSDNDVDTLFEDQKASDHPILQASREIPSGSMTSQIDATEKHRPRVHNSEIQRLEREQMYQDQTMRDDYFLDAADYDNADKNDFTMLEIGEGLSKWFSHEIWASVDSIEVLSDVWSVITARSILFSPSILQQ